MRVKQEVRDSWPSLVFHLAREDVEDLTSLLSRLDQLEEVELSSASGIDGRLFVAPSGKSAPAWTEPLRTVAELPALQTQSAGAVLLFKAAGRIFGVTFGRGHLYLQRELLVSDFGLRTAANLVDPTRLASIDSRAIERTVFTSRRQASQGVAAGELGFEDSREFLQGITGRPRNSAIAKRLTGSESLHLSRSVEPGQLPTVAQELLDAYSSVEYRSAFRNIDRMRQITGARVDELNRSLVQVLNLPERGGAYLAPPEIVDWGNVAGFRFSGDGRGVRRQDLTLEDYTALRGEVTLESIASDAVSLIARDTDRAAIRWPVHRCLIWEYSDEDEHLVLSNGQWWIVDPDYVARVDRIVGSIAQADVPALPFDPGTDADEAAYNQRFADELEGSRALDRELASIAGERGQVELCDVLGPGLRLIHVKRGLRSQNLSYLFDQAIGSAEALRHLPDVRRRLLELAIGLPGIPERIDVEGAWPWGTWEVTVAVVSKSPERVPSQLPFLGRAHLARTITALERLGFRVTYLAVPIA